MNAARVRGYRRARLHARARTRYEHNNATHLVHAASVHLARRRLCVTLMRFEAVKRVRFSHIVRYGGTNE